MTKKASQQDLLRFTTTVVSAYLGNNKAKSSDISKVIKTVHSCFAKLNGVEQRTGARKSVAAIPVKSSITPDYLVCLEDGKKLKMLKRHLRTTYGMSPEQYRAKWGLSPDYPMVAPNYAAKRSEFAKKIGLGKNS
ncbi:MucR family transcriptional regulator [Curvivirga sp.]|uniref:MucR family transcriptional regulator n=1 Tax=Curvivirga sp. TaxID=2856848 RepID=UPI003B5BB9CD